jgi:hypothetical protein
MNIAESYIFQMPRNRSKNRGHRPVKRNLEAVFYVEPEAASQIPLDQIQVQLKVTPQIQYQGA